VSDWVTFEGAIETVDWGRASYTIVRLPSDAAAALASTRRVEGEFADHPVNLAIARAPVVDGPFLWAGQSLIDRTGLSPGQRFEIRLRPAPDDTVDTPPDVSAALAAAGVAAQWEALTPGKRRSLLYRIDTARAAATRDKRIAALVAGLEA
jgi:hypothetical protein